MGMHLCNNQSSHVEHDSTTITIHHTLPVHLVQNIPFVDLTEFQSLVISASPEQTVVVCPESDPNVHCKINFLRLATHLYNFIVSLEKPRLNLIINLSTNAIPSSSSPSSSSPSTSPSPSSEVSPTWKCIGHSVGIHSSNEIYVPPFRTFSKVAVGGTFDRLHAGHRLLITAAAWATLKSLRIGITDDSLLVRKKHRHLIADVHQRGKQAVDYAKSVRPDLNDIEMSILLDPAGASGTDPDITALVVSSETADSAKSINQHRLSTGLNQFNIIVVDVLNYVKNNSSNHDGKLSSTALRQEDVARDKAGSCPMSTLERDRESRN